MTMRLARLIALWKLPFAAGLLALSLFATARGAEDGTVARLLAGDVAWTVSGPLLAPESRSDDPCHAIKDPTFVHHAGQWHLFATIKCRSRTQMEQLSFARWTMAQAARRHVITLVDAYHCAPQVFFFRPQQKWYLIYQWSDPSRDDFGPGFSTLDAVDAPQTLTKPRMLYPRKPASVSGWLDFWVICDMSRAHLFFTSLDGRMWRAETPLEKFPHGWTEPQVVLQGDIFEASHTYKLAGRPEYLTIVEAQASAGRRYYKAYLAERLDGDWRPLAASWDKPFAAIGNIHFEEGVASWTDSISHGELVRKGVDETMEVDPAGLQFVFQGCSSRDREGKDYGAIPWRIGMASMLGSDSRGLNSAR